MKTFNQLAAEIVVSCMQHKIPKSIVVPFGFLDDVEPSEYYEPKGHSTGSDSILGLPVKECDVQEYEILYK